MHNGDDYDDVGDDYDDEKYHEICVVLTFQWNNVASVVQFGNARYEVYKKES